MNSILDSAREELSQKWICICVIKRETELEEVD